LYNTFGEIDVFLTAVRRIAEGGGPVVVGCQEFLGVMEGIGGRAATATSRR